MPLRFLPQWRNYIARAASAIKTILSLGPKAFLRSDIGVNGKLAVDLLNTASGSLTDYLDNSSIDWDSTSRSISITFKVDNWTSGSFQTIFKASDGTNNNRYQVATINSGDIQFTVQLNGSFRQVQGAHGVTSGFANITCVYTENNSLGLKVYVNGTEITYDTQNDDTTGLSFGSNLSQLIFGGDDVGSNNPLDGAIDQCIITEKALTEAEITEIINGGSGLKYGDLTGSETFYSSIAAWYDFDSPANFGRESSQETHAVELDGANDYFEIENNNFDVSTVGSFTTGGWFMFDTLVNETITASSEESSSQFLFEINSSGKLSLKVFDEGTAVYIGAEETTASLLTDTWYHLVASWDGVDENGISIYINGSASALTTITQGTFSSVKSSNKFTVGSFDPVGETYISDLGVEMVFEQTESTQISELAVEIIFEEV